MLQSDLCDRSDAYIAVKRKITVTAANIRDWKNRSLAFKNIAPFISYISKIRSGLINHAGDYDVAMPR